MSRQTSSKHRYIVAQSGARRSYAVPFILHQAGLLERFYTDVCGNVGWGRWLSAGGRLPWIGTKLRRLANRRVQEVIREKTVTFVWPNLRWFWRSVWASKEPTNVFRQDVRRHQELGEAVAGCDFGRATHLYLMFSEFTPLMWLARERGLKVVSEIYILISTNRLVAEERRLFPGWEAEPPDWEGVLREFNHQDALLSQADFYICPSESVAQDLVKNWNIAQDCTAVVPYGMSPTWLQLVPETKPGRILFVGTADLRKGIHYLAMAAEELVRRGRKYEFRVAGHVEELVRNQPACRHLTFLGRVPRERIHEEFQQADVFTLPSLAEGSAEVTYEALAAALPLVVTASAGSVARDGIEGILIPERDPIALADAIESIVENRALRTQFATAARQRAAEYTWDRYGERLISALESIPA
ncbi:glycosyltransferase family 4 protein [Prosthecobacter algae]|uniref:Glycosyltransferase family 4 protein n=1 Tax=Prosthecobacter algae TaxID=1144682 RepID=A0ABP9NW37_9BACT